MCIPFGEQLEAKDRRIATLESQLAAMTTRAEKAEAERVVAYVPKSFCRDQCAHWKPELEGCGEWKKEHCEVRYFHDYLRDHNMIREAE